MTGTIDVLRAIAEGHGPSRWIAALGYAGWGEGQLDEEMTRHGWFAAQGELEDPVRHADRRALGRGVQGRRHRSAPAGERDRGGVAWAPERSEAASKRARKPADTRPKARGDRRHAISLARRPFFPRQIPFQAPSRQPLSREGERGWKFAAQRARVNPTSKS